MKSKAKAQESEISNPVAPESNDLVALEAEIAALRADQERRRALAQTLLAEAGEREITAQQFLDDNAGLLPYRVAAAAVGDETFTPQAVDAFKQELETARATVAEMQTLQQGLVELIRADWTSNSRLTRALHKRDAEQRRQKLLAEGRRTS